MLQYSVGVGVLSHGVGYCQTDRSSSIRLSTRAMSGGLKTTRLLAEPESRRSRSYCGYHHKTVFYSIRRSGTASRACPPGSGSHSLHDRRGGCLLRSVGMRSPGWLSWLQAQVVSDRAGLFFRCPTYPVASGGSTRGILEGIFASGRFWHPPYPHRDPEVVLESLDEKAIGRSGRRRRPNRWGTSDRCSVDDQHGHGRRGGHVCPGQGPG